MSKLKKQMGKAKDAAMSALKKIGKVLKKGTLPVLAFLATLAIFGLVSAKGPQWHGDYIRSKVGSVTLKIVKDNTERSGGTGFHVRTEKGNDYILTNAHICEMAVNGQVLAVTPDGKKRMNRRVIESSEDHDLCLVEGLPNMKGVPLAAKDPEIGELIGVVGHPALYPLTLSRGEFRGFTTIQLVVAVNVEKEECSKSNQKLIEMPPDSLEFAFGLENICIQDFSAGGTSAMIFPGNSGSATVNFWGNLIGVIFAGDRRGSSGFFVPLKEIRKFLTHY
jgi:S1-C subfamily serine protease